MNDIAVSSISMRGQSVLTFVHPARGVYNIKLAFFANFLNEGEYSVKQETTYSRLFSIASPDYCTPDKSA